MIDYSVLHNELTQDLQQLGAGTVVALADVSFALRGVK